MSDGGPAFPGMASTMNQDSYLGMSLRDWFAGKTLRETIAAFGDVYPSPRQRREVAEHCYLMAADMLAERDRQTEDAE